MLLVGLLDLRLICWFVLVYFVICLFCDLLDNLCCLITLHVYRLLCMLLLLCGFCFLGCFGGLHAAGWFFCGCFGIALSCGLFLILLILLVVFIEFVGV